MMEKFNYIVITPVRNEGEFIKKTIKSMLHQIVKPSQWIIVDDGSSDDTREIVDEYFRRYSWIDVIHRKDRGCRKPGTGVIEAFYDGFKMCSVNNWQFLVKLDGDLSFDPNYFKKCLEHFKLDAKLGIGGGAVVIKKGNKEVIDSANDPPFHVRGATKIYRRECWERISPLLKAPGWDTVDEVKANMYGWTTKTFRDLHVFQLKPTGGAEGTWQNWFKNGLANYVAGYHPIFMLGKCIKRMFSKPYVVGSIALWFGFLSGYFGKIDVRVDNKTKAYIRTEQMKYLLGRPSIYSS